MEKQNMNPPMKPKAFWDHGWKWKMENGKSKKENFKSCR